MSVFKGLTRFAAVLALGLAVTLPMVDHADARQGGSMGSRGSRTYQAPAATNTAPSASQPIQRSATPYNQSAPMATPARTGGLFGNGFGGALMRGLLIGGLVGMLFGGGLGGLSGFLGLLLQVALIAGVVMLALRFFANRRQPAPAGAGYGMARDNGASASGRGPTGRSAVWAALARVLAAWAAARLSRSRRRRRPARRTNWVSRAPISMPSRSSSRHPGGLQP